MRKTYTVYVYVTGEKMPFEFTEIEEARVGDLHDWSAFLILFKLGEVKAAFSIDKVVGYVLS